MITRSLWLSLCLAAPLAALAEPPPPHPPGAQGDHGMGHGPADGGPDLARDWPRVSASLGLDAGQQKKIEDLFYGAQKDGIELRAKADHAGLDLRRALGEDTPDEAAVKKAFAAHAAADSALKYRRVELMLSVRKVLSVEQWRSFLAMRGERR